MVNLIGKLIKVFLQLRNLSYALCNYLNLSSVGHSGSTAPELRQSTADGELYASPPLGPRSKSENTRSNQQPPRLSLSRVALTALCQALWRCQTAASTSYLSEARRSGFWVDSLLLVVSQNRQHQRLQILVLDFVLEDVDLTSKE